MENDSVEISPGVSVYIQNSNGTKRSIVINGDGTFHYDGGNARLIVDNLSDVDAEVAYRRYADGGRTEENTRRVRAGAAIAFGETTYNLEVGGKSFINNHPKKVVSKSGDQLLREFGDAFLRAQKDKNEQGGGVIF